MPHKIQTFVYIASVVRHEWARKEVRCCSCLGLNHRTLVCIVLVPCLNLIQSVVTKKIDSLLLLFAVELLAGRKVPAVEYALDPDAPNVLDRIRDITMTQRELMEKVLLLALSPSSQSYSSYNPCIGSNCICVVYSCLQRAPMSLHLSIPAVELGSVSESLLLAQGTTTTVALSQASTSACATY